ncbi:uncharacterized protein [Halyomorpha halys]|uniref:uncharacterized protein n=1 Tax=Halyomorpha halys TaxID=286706 RepID=UPI0006D4FDF7|nr:uncharacterized protein LOC106690828 [Halyomorpha halys]
MTSEQSISRATILERRMRGLKRHIKGISEIDTTTLSDADANVFEVRLNEAKQLWTEFREAWTEREELTVAIGEDDTFPDKSWYQLYDILKEEIMKAGGALLSIKEHRDARKASSHSNLPAYSTFSQSGSYSQKPQLPRIPIPTLSGDLLKWSHFHDTFVSLVHDELTLTKIEKFHYLIGALKGEAAAVISRFPVEANSYELVWKRVVETYQNPWVLANVLIHRIRDFNCKGARSDLQRYEQFLTGVADSVHALRALQLKDATDFLLTTIALRTLDPETRRQFQLSLGSSQEFPTVDNVMWTMCAFVRQKKNAIRMSQDADNFKSPGRSNETNQKQRFVSLYASSSRNRKDTPSSVRTTLYQTEKRKEAAEVRCPLCKGGHLLSKCETFIVLPLTQKLERVRTFKVCWNCLRKGHEVATCRSQFQCRMCCKKHHTLIHRQEEDNSATIVDETSNKPTPTETFIGFGSTPSSSTDSMVLLGTVCLLVKLKRGDFHMARAVLDSGSQHTFISSALAHKIGANIANFDHCITSLGESAVPMSHLKGSTSCTIRPLAGKEEYNLSPVVVDRITSSLPSSVVSRIMRHPLSDQRFGESGPVDLLIGGDLYPRILVGAPYPTEVEGLYFKPTVFGLVVSGVVHNLAQPTSCSLFFKSTLSVSNSSENSVKIHSSSRSTIFRGNKLPPSSCTASHSTHNSSVPRVSTTLCRPFSTKSSGGPATTSVSSTTSIHQSTSSTQIMSVPKIPNLSKTFCIIEQQHPPAEKMAVLSIKVIEEWILFSVQGTARESSRTRST